MSVLAIRGCIHLPERVAVLIAIRGKANVLALL